MNKKSHKPKGSSITSDAASSSYQPAGHHRQREPRTSATPFPDLSSMRIDDPYEEPGSLYDHSNTGRQLHTLIPEEIAYTQTHHTRYGSSKLDRDHVGQEEYDTEQWAQDRFIESPYLTQQTGQSMHPANQANYGPNYGDQPQPGYTTGFGHPFRTNAHTHQPHGINTPWSPSYPEQQPAYTMPRQIDRSPNHPQAVPAQSDDLVPLTNPQLGGGLSQNPREYEESSDYENWQFLEDPQEIKQFFKKGHVFIARHTQIVGSKRGTRRSMSSFATGADNVICKDRRFVVMRNMKFFSTCIAIQTYEGRGCAKRSVNPYWHSQIYSTHHPEPLLPGEKEFVKSAIRLRLENGNGHLRPESRLNYARIYNIDHNQFVKSLGHIAKDDFVKVQTYFRQTQDTSL